MKSTVKPTPKKPVTNVGAAAAPSASAGKAKTVSSSTITSDYYSTKIIEPEVWKYLNHIRIRFLRIIYF